VQTLSTDKATGETHLRHRAHWVENALYYKGRVVFEKAVAAAPEVDDTDTPTGEA
jgi:large subunit ribosomal protein L32